MEVTTKKRISYFDIAKGVLILLLVFAHFRSAVIRIPYDSPYFEMVYGWNHIFTCFYMPAFFIISGFCSNFNKPFKEFLMSLIKKLLIPLVAFTVLTQATSAFINKQNFFELLFSGAVLWFLWAMLISKLIFYGIKKT